MGEGGNIEKHLYELEELFEKLACAGQEMEMPLKIAMIYRSLPESYGSLVTALEGRPDADQTMELVKQKLIDEHQRRQERSGNVGENAMKIFNRKKKIEKVCFQCGKPGHFRRNCPQLPNGGPGGSDSSKRDARSKPSSAKAKQAEESDSAICFVVGNNCSGPWIVDSGCSSHMTNDKSFFDKLDTSAKVKVVLADGSETMSGGIGEGTVKCVNGENSLVDIPFKDVLYVPALDSGLISVRKLVKRGLKVEFSGSRCEILSAEGKVVAVAEPRGNLFALKVAEEARLGKEARHLQNCQHTWHRRLGHRDPAALDEIQRKELSKDFKVQDCGIRQVCQPCLEGKSCRIPFPKTASNRTQRVLDVIHTDVCGPMANVTPGGARYLMTIIDDYSRYTVVCLLKQKSDVADCIKRYVAHVKNMFGRAPCVIRSDGGGEYTGHDLKRYYEQEGIQAQYTAAYSPQQNGVAERKNRSLQEMATCMLLDAGLDKKYWGEAVATATYLQNRLPSRAVDTTPYERWYGRKPSLSHLKVFGCPAFVHIPDVKRSKLDSKAKKLLFVGYCSDRKAFRFLNTDTNEITISRDARFVELQEETPAPGGLQSAGEEYLVEVDAASSRSKKQAEENPRQSRDEESEEEAFFDWDDEQEQPDQTEATGGAIRRDQRSTRGVLPKRLEDYVVNAAMLAQEEPATYEEAVSGAEQGLWKEAMAEEYRSLMDNRTWKLVELPAGRTPISCKWVYKKKHDSVGNVSRFKARLVARGFSQRFGLDYDAVFAPVATQTTLRILLTVAGQRNMHVHHLDVKCAYLHGKLKEEVFMQQPKGFVVPGKERLVCRLERSLYGLKQAARVWNETISALLRELGFTQSVSDPCLYVKRLSNGGIVYLLIYVDDMIVVSTVLEEIKLIENQLQKKISLTSLGEVNQFLGVRVTRDEEGCFCLDQAVFIKVLAQRFGLQNAKGSSIPLDPGYYRSRENSQPLESNEQYHSLVGALLYIAVNTRPDVAASVSILSRQISSPTETDWTELKRIVRYLLKTVGYKLKLSAAKNQQLVLVGFCDADWSGDPSDRKSNSGYMFQLDKATICWASRKQTSVSLSSMEAEYMALSEACRELVWLRQLLEEMGEHQTKPTTVLEDNRSCIEFVETDRKSRRSKHIDTRVHYTKDLVDKGVVALHYCPTEEMAADILTKPLGAVKQQRFVEAMGLVSTDDRTAPIP